MARSTLERKGALALPADFGKIAAVLPTTSPQRRAPRAVYISGALLVLATFLGGCQTSLGGDSRPGVDARDQGVRDASEPSDSSASVPDARDAEAGTPDATREDAASGTDATVAEDTGASADTGPDAATDAAGPDAAPDAGTSAPRTYARTLFSGHSLMDNPMADNVELLADSLNKDFDWNQQIVLGSTIRYRTEGPGGNWSGYSEGKNRFGAGMNILDEFRSPSTIQPPSARYDTLVITSRNDILDVILWEDADGHLRHYHDRLIDANSAGRTFYNQVWLGIDKSDPQPWLDHVPEELFVWECVVSKLNLTLQAAGRSDRISVTPGGFALARLVEEALAGNVPGITGTERERLDAIFLDDVHMTPLGDYFIASVIYVSIFDESPVGGSAPSQVTAAQAAYLQRLAWDIVGNYDEVAGRTRSMSTCLTRIANDICPEYRALKGENDRVCTSFWSNPSEPANPFVWPDPNWSPLPAP